MCDVLDRWAVALIGVAPDSAPQYAHLLLSSEEQAREHMAEMQREAPEHANRLEVRRVALYLPCEGGEKNHLHPTPREDLVDALNRRSRANEILRSIGQLTGKESVDELLFKAMKPPTH